MKLHYIFLIMGLSFTSVSCGWRHLEAVDGNRSIIYSVKWQDNIQITVQGFFSAHRNGQLFYSDFADGTINESVNDFDINVSGNLNSREYHYSKDKSLTSGRAALWRAKPGDAGGFAAVNLPDLKNVFVSYDYLPEIINGSGGVDPRINMGQIVSSSTYENTQAPVTGATWLIDPSGNNNLNSYHHSGTDSFIFSQDSGSGSIMNGKWNRHVMRSLLNDPGVKNGELYFKEFVNLDFDNGLSLLAHNLPYLTSGIYTHQEWVSDAITTLQNAAANSTYKAFVLPTEKTSEHEVDIWIDNIFINDSEERVEICNAEIYENCTIHMIQPTVTRTSSLVTFSVRVGKLKNLDPNDLYIHVFNKDGGHSYKGYHLAPYVNY